MFKTAPIDSSPVGFRPFGMANSKRMEEISGVVELARQTQVPVLIQGEAGTGKEFIARAIHDAGPHAAGPFVKISSLGFSGDLSDREIEKLPQGTLFLDEITSLSLSGQAKLLALCQSSPGYRLIAATSQDLEAAIQEKKVREDFYYYVSVILIPVPPLRERRDDIPLLARYFVDRFNQENQRQIKSFSEEALACLLDYPWPGNIPELENVIKRACLLCPADTLSVELFQKMSTANQVQKMIAGDYPKPLHEEGHLPKAVAELEKQMIKTALLKSGGNQRRASQFLGITERMLGYKLKRYGYKPK